VRQDIADWLLPGLKGRDLLFVTLTSRYKIKKDELSLAISKLVHRVKRKVFGRKGEGTHLATVVILEPSYQHGVHAHLILENPYSVTTSKKFHSTVPIAKLITQEWAALGLGGSSAAQDTQAVYDLDGAVAYLSKTIGGTRVLDRLDINNFCLPNQSTPPIQTAMSRPDRDNQ